MFGFVKQSTYDADIAALHRELDETAADLMAEQNRARTSGRLASELLAERDAARIERDTAQRERDEYRVDAMKHRRAVSNLIPGGPKRKPLIERLPPIN